MFPHHNRTATYHGTDATQSTAEHAAMKAGTRHSLCRCIIAIPWPYHITSSHHIPSHHHISPRSQLHASRLIPSTIISNPLFDEEAESEVAEAVALGLGLDGCWVVAVAKSRRPTPNGTHRRARLPTNTLRLLLLLSRRLDLPPLAASR